MEISKEEANELYALLLKEYINPVEYPLVRALLKRLRAYLEIV